MPDVNAKHFVPELLTALECLRCPSDLMDTRLAFCLQREILPFTADIEAAVTLFPRDKHWELELLDSNQCRAAKSTLYGLYMLYSTAHTTPIAVCMAALRAHLIESGL